jgi:thioredoxin reductase
MSKNKLPVAVIGGGPIGLAAAVHLLKRGETPIIFEAAKEVSGNVRKWAHVRLFSPWKYNVDPVAVEFLEAAGWEKPALSKVPTGGQLIDEYLQPLAELPELRDCIHLDARVQGVTRLNIDKMKEIGRQDAPFVVQVLEEGRLKRYYARAVIDASGTWENPNPAGSGGIPALGEIENRENIFYGIPDVLGEQRDRYANRSIAVVGGGHSAINALLELGVLQGEFPDTKLHWILRKPDVASTYGGQSNDELVDRGMLGIRIQEMVERGNLQVHTPFFIDDIFRDEKGLVIEGLTREGRGHIIVSEIIVSTGSRPDLRFINELRVELDMAVECPPALATMIDPNFHSCGSVKPHGEAELRHPEKDFYIVGMKSYGRAPTFLMATGYEQVRSVVAGLVGDWEAARAVELVLPETGVCGVNNWVNANEFNESGIGLSVHDQLSVDVVSCCSPAQHDDLGNIDKTKLGLQG